eukprot:CAMPEP_0198310544 /NCGR_PEP_ID=MMETSP1450-20131203/2593_1 /TAXON_ID=753684 ORGANISM="Madagascaria erythrocladiodes, Strain CCMP3234" /NCGR_SAMPLE_ID=MMETSP1450 /ASSEMBLY_ACC=CAM_ASM_001115 /LENGTH=73 /DNA_ID=CAMNT_0044013383 /DNA_START=180 /DNA_END=398 /DNA_ORIENTATION=+
MAEQPLPVQPGHHRKPGFVMGSSDRRTAVHTQTAAIKYLNQAHSHNLAKRRRVEEQHAAGGGAAGGGGGGGGG